MHASDTYLHIPTAHIQAALTGAGFTLGATFQSRGQGTTHVGTATLPDVIEVFGVTCRPHVWYVNSYRGESSLKFRVGLSLDDGTQLVLPDWSVRVIHRRGPMAEAKLAAISDACVEVRDYIRSGRLAADFEAAAESPLWAREGLAAVASLGTVTERVRQAALREWVRLTDAATHYTLWDLWRCVARCNTAHGRASLAQFQRSTCLLDDLTLLVDDAGGRYTWEESGASAGVPA